MKKILTILSIALFIVFAVSSCQSVDDLKPSVARLGINSIKAKFVNEDGTYSREFEGKVIAESDEIVIEIPEFFGSIDNLVTEKMLERMRVRADLDDNVTVTPSLLYLNLNEDNVIYVTNQRKEVKRYTVKGKIVQPPLIENGIKIGSQRLLFAKKLKADLGITIDHLTSSIALSGDHLVLNTRGENSLYINAKTGEPIGHLELGDVKGGVRNFYNTSDSDGNILLCNLTPNDGNTFKIWRINSVESTPKLFLEWDANGKALGRKISITGSLDGNAIIVAPIYGWNQDFARWQVINGVLKSTEPEIVVTNVNHWGTAADIVQTSATDTHSDYFVASYAYNIFSWLDGTTNKIKANMNGLDTNFLHNCVDYIEFNNAKYAATAWIHMYDWTWNPADMVWLLDVSDINKFYGVLESDLDPNASRSPAIVWKTEYNKWGAVAVGEPANLNLTGDVLLSKSDDGYFMTLYFLFTNGYVVGYQFDCIDI